MKKSLLIAYAISSGLCGLWSMQIAAKDGAESFAEKTTMFMFGCVCGPPVVAGVAVATSLDRTISFCSNLLELDPGIPLRNQRSVDRRKTS
jgi:hypothetical protein